MLKYIALEHALCAARHSEQVDFSTADKCRRYQLTTLRWFIAKYDSGYNFFWFKINICMYTYIFLSIYFAVAAVAAPAVNTDALKDLCIDYIKNNSNNQN